MLRTIHLHGDLATRFQSQYHLDVENPAEALRAIMIQVRGFEAAIREGEFVCVRGSLDNGVDCDEDLLKLNFGSVTDFHLMPAAVGAGRGTGKILIGIALIGATILTGGAALAGAAAALGGSLGGASLGAIAGAAFGGSAFAGFASLGGLALAAGGLLVLGGTAQALSMMPKTNDEMKSTDQKAGYVFNGAINTNEQGGAVPLVFGRIEAGSVIVSAGTTAERMGEIVDSIQVPVPTGTIELNLP